MDVNDIVGKTIGNYEVLAYSRHTLTGTSKKYKRRFYTCKCSLCGTELEASRESILRSIGIERHKRCCKRKELEQLIGKRFQYVTVIAVDAETSGSQDKRVLCRCDCGAEHSYAAYRLKADRIGCPDCASKRVSSALITHGYMAGYKLKDGTQVDESQKLNIKIYQVWDRCRHTIAGLCDEWKDINVFAEWYRQQPNIEKERAHIARRDTGQPASPSNCYITCVTITATGMFEAFGISATLQEWAKLAGLNITTLQHRIYSGMDIYDAVTRPYGVSPRKPKKLQAFYAKWDENKFRLQLAVDKLIAESEQFDNP